MPKDLDNEGNDGQNNDNPPMDNPPTDPPPQDSKDNNPADNKTPEGYVTEESYQGLQRVVAKRDKEIGDLKTKLDDVATSLEEMKTDSGSLSEDKQKLETNVTEAQTALQRLEDERDSLNKQLEQQGVIMQEFPDLAQMAEYIPIAESADDYRENAKKFQDNLGEYVDDGVKKKLSGSTPPAPVDGKETIDENEEDKLWSEVYKYAGVPGKEKEYTDSNEKLQKHLASKSG